MCRQGRTYEPGGVKDESADAIRKFNDFVRKDARVDVVVLPFRDGVSIVTRRCAPQPAWKPWAAGVRMLLRRLSQAFTAALVWPSCSASMRGKPCHKWSQGCSVPLATCRRDGHRHGALQATRGREGRCRNGPARQPHHAAPEAEQPRRAGDRRGRPTVATSGPLRRQASQVIVSMSAPDLIGVRDGLQA